MKKSQTASTIANTTTVVKILGVNSVSSISHWTQSWWNLFRQIDLVSGTANTSSTWGVGHELKHGYPPVTKYKLCLVHKRRSS
ncbi:hypothetical protein HZ326_24638 [Fusarium oxysporum f. sp. albedinis]|nr:hypothetical protein HZ326_24638 [Fusarium oxysporum f. sp. albedinis]